MGGLAVGRRRFEGRGGRRGGFVRRSLPSNIVSKRNDRYGIVMAVVVVVKAYIS